MRFTVYENVEGFGYAVASLKIDTELVSNLDNRRYVVYCFCRFILDTYVINHDLFDILYENFGILPKLDRI
jgi:hypothetical protein